MVLPAECAFFPPHHHWNHTFKRHLQNGSPTLLVQKRTNALRKVHSPAFTLHHALPIGLFKLVKETVVILQGSTGVSPYAPKCPVSSLKCLCSFLSFKAHIH